MTRPTDTNIKEIILELDQLPYLRHPDLAYEDGIRNALDWVLGNIEDDPLSRFKTSAPNWAAKSPGK